LRWYRFLTSWLQRISCFLNWDSSDMRYNKPQRQDDSKSKCPVLHGACRDLTEDSTLLRNESEQMKPTAAK
jgi:hypothetical protein